MSNTLATQVVAEAAKHHEKVNHWIFGGIAIVALLLLLILLLLFAGGREHS